jgi:hypothetical protein
MRIPESIKKRLLNDNSENIFEYSAKLIPNALFFTETALIF